MLLTMTTFLIYILFGILLSVLVLALHQRLQSKSPTITRLATIFGVIWVALVIACGMIENIGLAAVIKLAIEQPEQAMETWFTISIITEGLGGGNEVVGGIWVLLVSIASFKTRCLPNLLTFFGMGVGIAGITTIYPADVLTEIFGLSQIVWFIWIGIAMQKPKQR